jgi:hypothetical protein
MLHFLGGQLVGLGLGFVAGAFAPAVGRKIKSLFVYEAAKAKAEVGKIAGAVEKKL